VIFRQRCLRLGHRAHASTEAVAHLLKPAVAGFLLEKEVRELSRLLEPDRPFAAILGGAKISGKIDVIESLLPQVDQILIGGAMANTFFLALDFATGKSLIERDKVELAQTLMASAGSKLILPKGVVVAPSLERASEKREVAPTRFPGRRGVRHRQGHAARFPRRILQAKTIFWNGPMGVLRRRRSIRARGRWRRRWSRRASGRDHGGRRWRLGRGGAWVRGQVHPRLNGWWCVA
jgi:phosphoglycerate kinase